MSWTTWWIILRITEPHGPIINKID